MLSLCKRFDDYETIGEVFRAFKNELLEITLVEKLWQIMELIFQEIFLDKLAENEISIEKLVQTQFEFLKCPNNNAA